MAYDSPSKVTDALSLDRSVAPSSDHHLAASPDEAIRILVVEDSEGDATIVRKRLKATANFCFEDVYAETLSAAKTYLLEEHFQVVLLDLNLPDSWGLETLEAIQLASPAVAVVVLTGNDNEEQGITALSHGAQDYLNKASILTGNLPRSIHYAWQRQRIDAQLKQANDILRLKSEELEATNRELAEANAHRQQAEAEIRKHRDEISRLNQLHSLNELASSIAHQIRQPLQAILAYARSCGIRLQKTPDDREAIELQLEKIASESQRAGQIVTQFTEYAAQPEPKHTTVEVSDLLNRCLDSIESRADEMGVQLKTIFEPRRIEAHVDATQIEQAMSCLLDNALQAFDAKDSSDQLKERREVVLSLEQINDHVRVIVRDTGKGTQLLNLEEMFEPFFSDKAESIGLGLSISRKIANQHGGSLAVTRNEGPGLSFQLLFPVANAV